MNVGFTLSARDGMACELNASRPAAPNATPLLRWGQDDAAEVTVALLGRLFYKKDLIARLGIDVPANVGDIALILAAFRQLGPKALEALEGEFSLAIWNGRQRCLYSARDASSAWPLYWTVADGLVAASTSLDELTALHPKRTLDLDYLSEYFMRPGAVAELHCEETPWVGLRRVLPGSILCLRPGGTVQRLRVWDWRSRIVDVRETTLEEAAQRVRGLFRDAVGECLGGGAVAAHLSGGMDSSSVVCVARDLMAGTAQPLTTLTQTWDRSSLVGERAYADLVIDQAPGLAPRFLKADDLLDFTWFDRPMPQHDEPYGWLFRLALDRLTVDAAQQSGARTILSGIGADELFETMPLSIADLLSRGRCLAAWRRAATWAQARNRGAWSALHDFGLKPLMPHGFTGRLGSWWRAGFGTWPDLGLFDIPPWINADFARRHQLRARGLAQASATYCRPFSVSMDVYSVESGIGNWVSWFLAAPQGMQVSHPFRDPRLVSYCMGLPEHLRAIPGRRKPVLQEAMRGILPEGIRTRRDKCHFNDVYWVGLAKFMRPLQDMVNASACSDLGIYDKTALLEVMEQAALGTGSAMACERINKTLALIAWHDASHRGDSANQESVALAPASATSC